MRPAVATAPPLRRLLTRLRRWDTGRTRRAGARRILVDGRTAVNYAMVAPVHAAMAGDRRVDFFFTASEEPGRAREIYCEAGAAVHLVRPAAASLMKFDAYVTSDFMWAPLPRGTCRIQMFHGVGGKYNFDAPTVSMRVWDRLFFVNRRRLANFVACGAIDPDSPATRLIGMPKMDALVNGQWRRDEVLDALGLDPARPTVLYAPTWSPASSLNLIGLELITALLRLPVNLVVKLHDRSRDLRVRYSGGVDWAARVAPLLAGGAGRLAAGHDVSPYLAAADVMITDHSSAGFEYLLLDRPLVRLHVPRLLAGAMVHPDYVALLARASTSTAGVPDTVSAVERALADPSAGSAERRDVAADLFHEPGTATARCVAALYEAIELPAPAAEPAGATLVPA